MTFYRKGKPDAGRTPGVCIVCRERAGSVALDMLGWADAAKTTKPPQDDRWICETCAEKLRGEVEQN